MGQLNGVETPLDDLLRQALAEGDIPFSKWMEVALYHSEHGYYMQNRKKTGLEPCSDFATSPKISPLLAGAIATFLAPRIAKNSVFVEYGGGEGDLGRQLVSSMKNLETPAGAYQQVELSPYHVASQSGDGVFTSTTTPDLADVVIAHEFVDALPFDLAEFKSGNWVTREVSGWPAEYATGANCEVPIQGAEGAVWPVMNQAKEWLGSLRVKPGGFVVIIDYGVASKAHWLRREVQVVRTYRHQQDGGNELREPGTKDITADVDFSWFAQLAQALGFQVAIHETQGEFLLRHGALEVLASLPKQTFEELQLYMRAKQLLFQMGDRFRVLILKKPL